MAKKFVSPGVFTTEIDQSFLAQGLGTIGAAVIGRTQKGPAFAPTVVTDFTEFSTVFGGLDPTMQAPYAAQNYLRNASTLTVVRVLGTKDGNSSVSNGSQLNLYAVTGSGKDVLSVIAVTPTWTATLSGTGSNFGFSFASGSSSFAGTASFVPSAANYIGKVLNDDPTQIGSYGHFIYKNFQWIGSGSGAPFGLVALSGTTTASFDYEWSNSSTPWVRSQAFGSNYFNLFKFWTLGAGAASTSEIKVTIANIKSSLYPTITRYGTFDVVIRTFGDTDNRPVSIETFTNCDLDPSSPNYLPRRIGDQYKIWDKVNRKNIVSGKYKNASKFIRVEIPTGVNAPAEALPWGHTGYPENTVLSGVLVDVPYVQNNLDAAGNLDTSNVWGIDLTQDRVGDRLKALATPGAQVLGAAFDLAYVSGTSSAGLSWSVYNTGSTAHVPTTASENGFTVAFFGGYDGFDLTQADPLSLPAQAGNTTVGVVSQKAAVDTVSNPDEIDLNLLAVPGTTNTNVVDYARQICNSRADCMFIMDVPGSSVSDVIGQLNGRGIDDNYVAAYYPDLKISDNVNNVVVTVKPSTVILGAYAFSDRVGQVFFAPAGLNRGGLGQFGVIDTADHLTFQDRNDLYEARINPIASFPNEGIVVFGQKTLQARPSALDRVNVRRLLIYAKKTIASAAKMLLFEPNNPSTWQRFLNTVNPILEDVRLKQGIERFKVVMDSTVNTPDVVDRNIMRGKIFLQPTRSAEFIDLQFVVTSSGVQFEE